MALPRTRKGKFESGFAGKNRKKNDEIHESLFSLTISDNGKGIPEDIEFEELESLGLQLVNVLVDQLDGEIELKRAQGKKFRITFKITERSEFITKNRNV